MTQSLPTVGRSALADHVYTALYDSILGLAVEPGARLNIDQLARQLDISPTPVREALARLEAEELVIKRPLSGYVTTPVSGRQDILDQYDVRLRLEPWLAGLAAARPESERRTAMEALADACAEAEPSALTDVELHDAVAALSGNLTAQKVLRRLNAHFHVYRYFRSYGSAASAGDEHAVLVRAVVDGDPAAARKAMRAHLSAARQRLVALG